MSQTQSVRCTDAEVRVCCRGRALQLQLHDIRQLQVYFDFEAQLPS
eukprot:SAG11_NODE_9110_length_942_cov_0.673784_1_plen_45_part_10